MHFLHVLFTFSVRLLDFQACFIHAECVCFSHSFLNFFSLLIRLLTASIAWPVPWVVQVGIILSTLGAALQSLTGAPRLLAAIANDDIIPVLKYFKKPDDEEPHLATLFTMLICAGCVILGNLDLISPVITMFFLLCYGGVNLSCLLLDLLDAPSWRPRFKFHHWSFSLLGALLCISEFCGTITTSNNPRLHVHRIHSCMGDTVFLFFFYSFGVYAKPVNFY